MGIDKMNNSKERKLHIGGKIKKEGWEIFNAVPTEYVDHEGNAKDLSRFEDNSFSVVYASHVLEHFDYQKELYLVLKEWHRVLNPGGKLLVSVPDLDILATMLTQKKMFSGQERFHIMRMIFGGHIDQYDYHVVGLNFEFLFSFLREAGYTDIKRVEGFGIFPDTSDMGFKNIAISLNVQAIKPL